MRIEWIEKYMTEAERQITENQVDEGLALLKGLLYDEPGYGSLHNHLGWAYMYYTAAAENAELHFNMAIKFQPDYAPPYLHLAALYARMERYNDVISVAAKGLTVKGANRMALLEQMARAHELKRDYAEAIKTYREALASTAGIDGKAMTEGIKRCRRKRLALMFTF